MLLVIGDGAEVMDTLFPLYRLGEDYQVVVTGRDLLTRKRAEVERLVGLGVRAVCITCGSPYTNPHIQRPAFFPPSDGYRLPEDPLVGVARRGRRHVRTGPLDPAAHPGAEVASRLPDHNNAPTRHVLTSVV